MALCVRRLAVHSFTWIDKWHVMDAFIRMVACVVTITIGVSIFISSAALPAR